jgi:muramoyltetrapeptide carboxypeptidase
LIVITVFFVIQINKNILNVFSPFLKHNHKVFLLSTARKVSEAEIKPAIEILISWGLEVILGANLFTVENQFAGSDEMRLSDLQHAMNDPEIKAIFCARGGYGTPRIIDLLDWSEFKKYPKWIVGFSDVTVLLNAAQNVGACSIHAPMLLFFDKPEYQVSISALKQTLFGGKLAISASSNALNRKGIAKGILVGGNLSLIVNSIGTPTAFESKGKILFLEDIDEYLYHIDRMILHLKRAGVFSKLAGLVVGHFSDMKDNAIPFGETAYQIIARNVAEFDFPVAFGVQIGHAPQNMPVVVGAKYILDVNEGGATMEIL